ncbi:uncharacterized protein LOC134855635 [Symsagittifera roscoffensis]|uniref:uncharacterized protein LOC134855635 n=1 Tax=Symsagittifera roscoffensis TaxID=84072 RepID=UPI00307B8F53
MMQFIRPNLIFLFLFYPFIIDDASSYESFEFILPDPKSEKGAECRNLNIYFCMTRFVTSSVNSSRVALWNDTIEIEVLSRYNYRSINWYSFDESENTACCKFQIRTYEMFGQDHGISPQDYMNKMTDFSSDGKLLRHLKVRYDDYLCANVIIGISYGTIRHKITVFGGHPDATFIVPLPYVGHHVITFERSLLKDTLTFDWFKLNVFCPGQPWICMKYPVIAQQI